MIYNVATFREHTTLTCNIADCDWKVFVVAPMAIDVLINMVWRHWAVKHEFVPPEVPGGATE